VWVFVSINIFLRYLILILFGLGIYLVFVSEMRIIWEDGMARKPGRKHSGKKKKHNARVGKSSTSRHLTHASEVARATWDAKQRYHLKLFEVTKQGM
jgi:hypothetical protein